MLGRIDSFCASKWLDVHSKWQLNEQDAHLTLGRGAAFMDMDDGRHQEDSQESYGRVLLCFRAGEFEFGF